MHISTDILEENLRKILDLLFSGHKQTSTTKIFQVLSQQKRLQMKQRIVPLKAEQPQSKSCLGRIQGPCVDHRVLHLSSTLIQCEGGRRGKHESVEWRAGSLHSLPNQSKSHTQTKYLKSYLLIKRVSFLNLCLKIYRNLDNPNFPRMTKEGLRENPRSVFAYSGWPQSAVNSSLTCNIPDQLNTK